MPACRARDWQRKRLPHGLPLNDMLRPERASNIAATRPPPTHTPDSRHHAAARLQAQRARAPARREMRLRIASRCASRNSSTSLRILSSLSLSRFIPPPRAARNTAPRNRVTFARAFETCESTVASLDPVRAPLLRGKPSRSRNTSARAPFPEVSAGSSRARAALRWVRLVCGSMPPETDRRATFRLQCRFAPLRS